MLYETIRTPAQHAEHLRHLDALLARGLKRLSGNEAAEYEQGSAELMRYELLESNRRAALAARPKPSQLAGGRGDVSLLDKALAGWIRNAHGIAIPRDEFEAAQRLGFDPRGGAFPVSLPLTRPVRGYSMLAAQGVSSDVRGGYLTGSSFVQQLEIQMKATSPLLDLAEVMVTDTGNEVKWPTIDDTDNTGEDLSENQEASDQAVSFKARSFLAHKIGSGIVKASNELVRDSAMNLATELGRVLGQRIGRRLNTNLTTGSGDQKAEGVVTGASLGVTAASATTISFDEVIRLAYSVDPAYRAPGGSVGFMAHSDVISYLRRLKDGDGQYLWKAADMTTGQPETLIGFPIWYNQAMASSIATTAKTLLFGSFEYYKVRLVGSIRFRILSELYAANDQTGFVSFLEHDGGLLAPSSTASLCPVRYLQQA